MTQEYEVYIYESAMRAEAAMFQLRNALMGTGIDKYDRRSRWAERVRIDLADLARQINRSMSE